MPYYLFQVEAVDELKLVKKLQLIEAFDKFREAKSRAKSLRSQLQPNEQILYQLTFADNLLMAEEQLQEKRTRPTLMEYEW
jgi:hypothetical protein